MSEPSMKNRNYGIDTMRIMLMLLIISGHLYTHTHIREILPFMSCRWIYVWLTQGIVISAVNCFIIITGYFVCSQPLRSKKIISIFMVVSVYSILIYMVMSILNRDLLSSRYMMDAFFPVLRNQYWFFTNYILLMLLSPVINIAVNALTKMQYQYLIVVITLFFFITPLFSIVFYQYDVSQGYGIIGFVSLYFIGAYLRRFPVEYSVKSGILILVMNNTFMLSSKILLVYLSKMCNLSSGTGIAYHINSVFQLVNGICLFLLCVHLPVRSIWGRRMVIWISSSVFPVYLIHDNPLVRSAIWNKNIVEAIMSLNFWPFIFSTSFIVIAIFTVSMCIDKVVQKVILLPFMNCLASTRLYKVCDMIDGVWKNE